MAKVRVRPETGTLYVDFQFRGVRCREQTALADTPANRRAVEALAKRIAREIAKGCFDYGRTFPDSLRAAQFGAVDRPADALPAARSAAPTFKDFAETWVRENSPRWRARYAENTRTTLDRILLPAFGHLPLDAIGRGELLGFQASVAERRGRAGQTISAKRINKLMMLAKAILNEGCDRHGLTSAARTIKPLKQKRTEVMPFTLEEVQLLIARVRADYRPYLTVRLLTGLRTGEADGLQWQDVDFDRGCFQVLRTHSRDGDGEPKTQSSIRTVPMVPQVRQAFQQQKANALPDCPWVFHSRQGNPIDSVNFTNRIWYPLLRNLGLRKRPPYHMRHTAATLMLAAGENPEWVASTLGHSTTEMLFRVYSRFVPNLTRNDGLAFAGLMHARLNGSPPDAPSPEQAPATPTAGPAAMTDLTTAIGALKALSPEQLAAVVALVSKSN
jgi:integrase